MRKEAPVRSTSLFGAFLARNAAENGRVQKKRQPQLREARVMVRSIVLGSVLFRSRSRVLVVQCVRARSDCSRPTAGGVARAWLERSASVSPRAYS